MRHFIHQNTVAMFMSELKRNIYIINHIIHSPHDANKKEAIFEIHAPEVLFCFVL